MATTKPTAPDKQREDVLDSERRANRDEPRNFKEDALEDKNVRVEPDGTGPTSTGTFDAPEDQRRGSGNPDKGREERGGADVTTMPDDPKKRGGESKPGPVDQEPELTAGVVPADRLKMREAIKAVGDQAEAEKVEEHLKETRGERKGDREPPRRARPR